MGPHYDNENGKYLLDEEVMNSHWLVDEDDNLFLIPRDGDGFDSYGPDDDDKLELLNSLSDDELEDADTMEEHGFFIIYPRQRGFNEESGYYYS